MEFSASVPTTFSLWFALSDTNEPYVSLFNISSNDTTVMKYDGTSWVSVGANMTGFGSITFDSTGELYMASGTGNTGNVTIKQFDGTDWVTTISDPLTTPLGIIFTKFDLDFNSDDEPHIFWGTFNPNGGTSVINAAKYVIPFVAVTSVEVETQDGIPAEIAEINGTLQLVAVVNPSNAEQTVIWSIESGSDFASVDTSGLVTATAIGTAVVRATSTEDETIFGEITITVSSLSVDDMALESVKFYPNPTTSIVYIEITEDSPLQIADVTGKIVHTQNLITGTNPIDVSGLASGVYFVKTKGETLKLVKQ